MERPQDGLQRYEEVPEELLPASLALCGRSIIRKSHIVMIGEDILDCLLNRCLLSQR